MVERASFRHGFSRANDTERGARRIQVQLLRRQQPFLQLSDEFLLLLGGLDFGEAFQVRMRNQLRGQRSVVLQEQQRGFLQPCLAGGGEHARPPGCAWKVFPGQGELLEIILQEQEGPLRIRAIREDVQQLRSLGHGRF
jgi:hypothetical protein